MENKAFVSTFDSLVKKGLCSCIELKDGMRLGAAVSGGADSIALVTSLEHIVGKENLEVITVNHNIRPAEETCGDADYVEQYAQRLGVKCTRIEIPRGKITSLAKERKTGIEEAARLVRYEAFEQFVNKNNIDYLCLAHNKNDQCETVLMRFLQGSSSKGLQGIPLSRGKYIRPLLQIDRSLIEQYLTEQNIEWKTDSTNYDTAMFRNKIRRTIMPVLDKETEGWKTAVLSAADKARDDEEYFASAVKAALEQIDYDSRAEEVSFDEEKFRSLPKAIQRRIISLAVENSGAKERVPYSFTESIMAKESATFASSKQNGSNQQSIRIIAEAKGLESFVKDARIVIKPKSKLATESGFFVIIKEIGVTAAGPWTVEVSKPSQENGIQLYAKSEVLGKEGTIVLPQLEFPFAFKSRQCGDTIETAQKSQKPVQKIFEDWHMESSLQTEGYFDRDVIPVIQQLGGKQENVCVWGSLLGYGNWSVRKSL